MRSAILMVASQNYLSHAKSLMVNCVRQGNWKGEFVLLVPYGTVGDRDLKDRGVDVVPASEQHWTNKLKFQIFNRPWLDRYDSVLYLDLDILVQRDLNEACHEVEHRFPLILTDNHSGTILDDWYHFGPDRDQFHDEYERLKQTHPVVMKEIRASCVMLFNPKSVPEGATDRMLQIQEDFKSINPGEYDQQVIDIVLYDQMEPIGKNFCTWWAFDMPGNRVSDDLRGWTGDEFPAVVHYWGMYAPWTEKIPDAGAYFNERLGRVCHELYRENLAMFDEVFPK